MTKKILFIIAFRDFRDVEYFVPREILEKEGRPEGASLAQRAGTEIKVASDETGLAVGADGGEVNIDMKLEDVNVVDFDAIIFIGGPGALKHLDNENSYEIARTVVAHDKFLAAICVAPIILAKAGVLAGKKATVWTSALDKSGRETLKEHGALYSEDAVARDGKIITANGPAAAKEFGEKLIEVLSE